mgnify:CR=1 FL=1
MLLSFIDLRAHANHVRRAPSLPPFSAAGTAKRTAPAQTPRPTFWLGAIMKISAGLCVCVSVCVSQVQAERHPVGGNKKNDRWEGEVEAAGPRRWRGEAGARHRPSAPASPGRAAGARGSGRRQRRGVGWVKSQEGRGARGGADSGPSGEADAPRAVRRRRRRDAATTTTSDGKVRRLLRRGDGAVYGPLSLAHSLSRRPAPLF